MAASENDSSAAGSGRASQSGPEKAPGEIAITGVGGVETESMLTQTTDQDALDDGSTPAIVADTGLQARILAEDAEFHRAHLRGLALSWGNLWIALAVMGGAAAGLSGLMADPTFGLAAGAILGVAVYGFIASLNGLRLDFEHERKVAQIHRTARLGAERVRIDDPSLVRSALRDVLREWMHGALLLRQLRQTSFWYRVAVGVEIGLALLAIAVFALLSPLSLESTGMLGAAALALTAYHGWREIRAGKERGLACALGENLDPTEALADRVTMLLEEVRDLRRRGERR